jgi:hypothetical protein
MITVQLGQAGDQKKARQESILRSGALTCSLDFWNPKRRRPDSLVPAAFKQAYARSSDITVPVIPPNDPRRPHAELAITLFWPDLIWNHEFDKRFTPIGNLLVNDKSNVVFAFPLDQPAVTDEMIDHAIGLLRSGKLEKMHEEGGTSFLPAAGETVSYAATGLEYGGVGAAAGAAIGLLKNIGSFFWGHQDWDWPDDLDDYVKRMQAIRGKADLCWHFSHSDSDRGCALLWIGPCGKGARSTAVRSNPIPAYTLLDGAARLRAKLTGAPLPATPPVQGASLSQPSAGAAPRGIVPTTAPGAQPAAAAAGCAFTVGNMAFPCSRAGWIAALRAARSSGAPVVFRRAGETINMRRCVTVLPSGGTPIMPMPQAPQVMPARPIAHRPIARRKRRRLRDALGQARPVTVAHPVTMLSPQVWPYYPGCAPTPTAPTACPPGSTATLDVFGQRACIPAAASAPLAPAPPTPRRRIRRLRRHHRRLSGLLGAAADIPQNYPAWVVGLTGVLAGLTASLLAVGSVRVFCRGPRG